MKLSVSYCSVLLVYGFATYQEPQSTLTTTREEVSSPASFRIGVRWK